MLLREAMGASIRHARQNKGYTITDISRQAQIALGYLSEVERGKKEASSEVLRSIVDAIGVSMSSLLIDASHIMEGGYYIPDTVPDNLIRSKTSV